MVINDFLRGKIPWYIPHPNWPERKPKDKDEESKEKEEDVSEGHEDVPEDEGWDGIDVESDDEKSWDTGHQVEDSEEEERIEDPRPRKSQKH